MSTAERVASTIRAEMARRRIDQGVVARRLGVSRPSVSRRLSGTTELTVSELVEVADLLGVAPAELIPGRGDE